MTRDEGAVSACRSYVLASGLALAMVAANIMMALHRTRSSWLYSPLRRVVQMYAVSSDHSSPETELTVAVNL